VLIEADCKPGKFSDKTALTDPRLADDLDELCAACAGILNGCSKDPQLVVASDDRGR